MSETVNVTADAPAIPSVTPAPAISGAPAAQPAISAVPAPAATPQAPEGYVPSYRLRETRESAIREAQTYWAQKETEYQNQLQSVQRQLHALVGVTPQGDPEAEQIRDQFGRLYPGLSQIEERADRILEILDRAGDLESQNQHYWQSFGRQTMDRLYEKASSSLGAPLTEEGKHALHASFIGYVQGSPDLLNRYTNDPTLIDEFWRAFTSNFIDPARRAATATVVDRTGAVLPKDAPSGAPRVMPAPAPANLDERGTNAWAQYQQTAKPTR